ncbi:aminopeptidase [Haladaptatus sp. AB618]|uniref:aminopeptidase n=1 Tax=Haladaptatus sp. AB618 TaxID=2934173 RepID=UPI00209C3FC9|nr:aminopeptidase [Haladaptatus sp. AB618]MCO8252625.1 aminopeptidase [Haladaptatus sp. AB618]
MDERIRNHAETIVDHSLDIEAGDTVVVRSPTVSDDLAVALSEALGERGAFPLVTAGRRDKKQAAFLRSVDADALETPEHEQALFEASDAIVHIRGHENASDMSDISAETHAAYRQAYQPIQQEILSSRWCLTQYPSPGSAQLAEMSTDAYEEFVYSAMNKDWDEQREFQEQMVEILDPADEVRIVSGETTDLTMSVADMKTINDEGKNNLPGGEVFTAPIPDSVEGEVLFDKPLVHQGNIVENVWLKFENGEVVDFSADKNEDVLAGVLDTDDGARRLGELGIGMNRDIDEFTYNMLFDEKMGDTVHLAVGMAYDICVPDDREPNESAVHVDIIVDMSEDSFIEVDGEIVQRNGTFRFEDGFEE